MKKESFFSQRIKPVFVMAVMTIVCIALVSGFYLSTQDLVVANEGLVLKRAVLFAAGIEVPESNAETNDLYDELVTEKEDLFIVKDQDGKVSALAFIAAGPGLWGEIEAVTAFKADGSFAGIDFIKQNETPGLGARITELWFKQQLRGKRVPLSMVAEGSGASAGSDGKIDSITGASRTSGYVLTLLNEAGEKADKLVKEVF